MRTRTEFPHKIRVIEHAAIPLSDGVTLSAMIWLPVDAEKNPVPAILEYLPYRKRDGTTERDALTHPYFAGHGYACVRVDMRGSGDSDGVLEGRVSEAGAGRRARGADAGSRRSPGAPARSASSASPGAASTACRSPRAARRS